LNTVFPQYGNGKLKLATGTFIQWSVCISSIATDQDGVFHFLFDEAFVSTPAISASGGYGNVFIGTRNMSSTGFNAYFYDQSGNILANQTNNTLQVIAIGRWK